MKRPSLHPNYEYSGLRGRKGEEAGTTPSCLGSEAGERSSFYSSCHCPDLKGREEAAPTCPDPEVDESCACTLGSLTWPQWSTLLLHPK
uniref:Uncharacterized protein n=1 Tax=Anolis carolinensis TaxID=28377 RepID=A0A803TSE6_ANOCA